MWKYLDENPTERNNYTMKNIFKKLTALTLALVMLLAMAPSVNAGVEYSVEDAYEECAALYPEFVDAVLEKGATEANIIRFLYDLQDYLLNVGEEITEENFESYVLEAINDLMSKRAHIKLRDALVGAFPGAVLDGAEGIIAPEFEPIVETIKRIIFDNGLLDEGVDDENQTTEPEEETTEPEVTPTEPEVTPTEPEVTPTEPEVKPTEPEVTPTEPEKETVTGGGNGGFEDDGEDATAPDETATTPAKPKVTFSDMNQATWAENAVYALVDMGVINGYPDGTFKPNNQITRAEFSKIIVLVSGRYYPTKETYTSTFTDVPTTAWEYPYVSAAYKFGFIKGRSETIFDPNSNITRADLCLIVYRYIQSINPEFKAKTNADGTMITFADAANVPSYAQEAVSALYSNGVAPLRDTVNNKFEPTLPATRAECALIVYNAINAALGL